MLRHKGCKQLSIYTELYHRIPENHILRRINSAISLSFVNELLEGSYCKHFGRPAKEPEMMLRILILKYLYNLSDERVMEELSVNLAYMFFIGIEPDEKLPETSLLTKFRKQHLHEIAMDEIITEIVRQCIEKGIIKSDNGIAIDTTHIEANTIKKVPERIMKHLAEKIFKQLNKEDYEIPDYTQIEDHNEAKTVMKEYLESVMKQAPAGTEAVQEAEEILKSDLFIEQKGIRSLVDKDARVGNKSKTTQFFGYKMEYCQTTDGSLITAVRVENGAYTDGKNFNKLYSQTEKSGLNVKSVCGDKAYFRYDILKHIKENGADAYIPVSASAYRIDEELYSYNKDSDQWLCAMGNETIKVQSRTQIKFGGPYRYLVYFFERERCRNCSMRTQCIGKSRNIAKKLGVSVNTAELYEYSQTTKTAEFMDGYRKRAKIEPKNAELKRFHGLSRAAGYGLRSVSTQAKLTAMAVNLKRIAKLVSAFDPLFHVAVSFLNSLGNKITFIKKFQYLGLAFN